MSFASSSTLSSNLPNKLNVTTNPVSPSHQGDSAKTKVQMVGDFVLEELKKHRASSLSLIEGETNATAQSSSLQEEIHQRKRRRCLPLFVGVQGPQGCGKSHLTDLLPTYLSSEPYNLRIASLSLDDLYLQHEELERLKKDYPENDLLHGRGQAGTHDLKLGESVFEALIQSSSSSLSSSSSSPSLKHHSRPDLTPDDQDEMERKGNPANEQRDVEVGVEVTLPIFDKSLFDGEGDRSDQVHKVKGPFDVIIFEGWMTGFKSLTPEKLKRCYEEAVKDPNTFFSRTGESKAVWGYDRPFFIEHKVESLLEINQELEKYGGQGSGSSCTSDRIDEGHVQNLWSRLGAFVQIQPVEMGYVWEWRLQQEHNMKAKNGGQGMSDEQVKAFIARYMPGYELFMDGIHSPSAPWKGHGLKLIVDKAREVTRQERF